MGGAVFTKDIHEMEHLSMFDKSMSNFDHSIDEGFEDALKEKPNVLCGQHSGWNFCGYVWFDGTNFVEQVWQYHTPVEEVAAPSLKELMENVNEKYGWD